MSLPTPPIPKVVALYGLLALTYALPSLPRSDDSHLGSLGLAHASSTSLITVGTNVGVDVALDRRAPPPSLGGIFGKDKNKQKKKKKRKGKGGKDDPSEGEASSSAAGWTPEAKDREFINKYKTKLATDAGKQDAGNFDDYNPAAPRPNPNAPEWFEYKVTAPRPSTAGSFASPAFEARINPQTGQMSISATYR